MAKENKTPSPGKIAVPVTPSSLATGRPLSNPGSSPTSAMPKRDVANNGGDKRGC